ncbi:MAG: hypothetical protein JWQ25_972 [Daejeonella sp.]|nr:hypothetical protein [Daejeonella sp.]
MEYLYSNTDRKIMANFKSNLTNATIHSINLKGRLRGLNNCRIQFTYPISVFSGKNGCGKTTLLALAACAYHNNNKGFRLPGKKTPYYTFSDFFIQTASEVAPQGINIRYKFLNDNWSNANPGFGDQVMSKNKGGEMV